MFASAIFGMDWPLLAAGIESVVVLVLLCLLAWLWGEFEECAWKYEQAREERDEARRTLQAIYRMSEIRRETIARMRRFS
jgi:hypothetical protein